MKIKSGKTTIDVAVENLNDTVLELKEQLTEITSFTDIKLIYAGKVLKDDMTIGSILGGFDAKLTMMGSTPDALHSLEAGKEVASKGRIIDDLSDGSALAKRPAGSTSKGPKQHNPYKFQSIQTLPNLPDEAKAREILNSLANDEGVLAVMKKHKWSVGALCELYPEGYVGVSDVCVMGLNENHGQRILLRLRTDDLKGFRKILSIRKVLCHELAHNEHSEHDGKFYVLMRQIEREIVELDWKNGQGRILQNGPVAEQYTPLSAPSSAAPTAHILGGSTDPLVQQFVPARYLAGTAAIMRLSAEEKEVEDNCASGRVEDVHGLSSSSQDVWEEMNAPGTAPDEDGAMDLVGQESNWGGGPGDNTREADKVEVIPADKSQAGTVNPPVVADPLSAQGGEEALPVVEAEPTVPGSTELNTQNSSGAVNFQSIREAVLASIDESVAFALSTESTAAPVEKLLALRDAVESMLAHCARQSDAAAVASLLTCLKVLHQIVSNAKVSGFPVTPLDQRYEHLCAVIRTTQMRSIALCGNRIRCFKGIALHIYIYRRFDQVILTWAD
jgi:hypothetical protein